MITLEEKIFDYLSKNLSPTRFEHSYNVSLKAVELAKKYGESIYKAQMAGLLHDCAKNKESQELINFYKNRKKDFKFYNEISKHSPKLLHSYVSCAIAKEEFKIKDKDILNAVKNHTLGRVDMSKLEMIVFVSDIISKERNYKGVNKIRRIANKNLREAFIASMKTKIEHVMTKNAWLCPQAIDTWNYYAK